MQHIPLDTAASAFRMPSVIQSGIFGFPSWRADGRRDIDPHARPVRRLVLDRFPVLDARLIRSILIVLGFASHIPAGMQ